MLRSMMQVFIKGSFEAVDFYKYTRRTETDVMVYLLIKTIF